MPFFRFFNIVSSASPELQSLFDCYTIKNIKDDNIPYISEVIQTAIQRSYGPQVKLDLQFPYDYNPKMVFSFKIKEMLTKYKENIISLNIPLGINPEILLQPDLEL